MTDELLVPVEAFEPQPGDEDWAVLAAGQATPWLRARLQEVLVSDPEAAERFAQLADPAYQAAVREAGAALAGPTPLAAVVRNPEPLPLTPDPAVREVAVRLRPNFTSLFLGISLLAASYLLREQLLWQLLIGAVFCFLIFAVDQYNTAPRTQFEKARLEGDEAKAQAIAEATGLRRDGS